MPAHNLVVEKTARYFTLSEPEQEIHIIWIVFHGYAQHPGYFIKKFNPLDTPGNLVVAPEGMNRFYQEGFSGRVVASWMTKDDRENDIQDYINFLNKLALKLSSNHPKAKVRIIGFSQGGATACRWAVNSEIRIDQLILWAASFPTDLDLGLNAKKLNDLNLLFVVGSQDPFIKEKNISDVRELLNSHNIHYKLKYFEGKHEIDHDLLKDISKDSPTLG